MRSENLKVLPACVVIVEPNTSVTLNAAIHFMIDTRAQILIVVCPFLIAEFSVRVAGHNSHILQMTLTPFITDRTVMRVIYHEPFHYVFSKFPNFFLRDGNTEVLCNRLHASHHDLSIVIVFVPVFPDGALTARSHGPHRRVPAKVRQVIPQRQDDFKEVFIPFYFMDFPVYLDFRHRLYSGMFC
jgi:hypothetical protein